MLKYLLIVILSNGVYSQEALVKKYSDQLDLETTKDGKCKYSRNELNKAYLNNLYNTNLEHDVKETTYRSIKKNFNCIFITRNLKRDSNKINISPKKVFNGLEDLKTQEKNVTGKIRYIGLVNKNYSYNLKKIKNHTELNLNIFFKIDSSKDIKTQSELLMTMQEKLDKASEIWSRHSMGLVQFHFKVVSDVSKANFSVELKTKNTRGPYDKKWSLTWSANEMAHEAGHMLGLDDEYDNVSYTLLKQINSIFINNKNNKELKKISCSGTYDNKTATDYFKDLKVKFAAGRTSKCDNSSIMCNSSSGVPQKWHIYTILKRFYL